MFYVVEHLPYQGVAKNQQAKNQGIHLLTILSNGASMVLLTNVKIKT